MFKLKLKKNKFVHVSHTVAIKIKSHIHVDSFIHIQWTDNRSRPDLFLGTYHMINVLATFSLPNKVYIRWKLLKIVWSFFFRLAFLFMMISPPQSCTYPPGVRYLGHRRKFLQYHEFHLIITRKKNSQDYLLLMSVTNNLFYPPMMAL